MPVEQTGTDYITEASSSSTVNISNITVPADAQIAVFSFSGMSLSA